VKKKIDNKVNNLINALGSVGIKPSKDVAQAIERSKLAINLPSPDQVIAKAAMAATQADLDKVVYEAALNAAVAEAARSVTGSLNRARERALDEAVRPWAIEVLPKVCEFFNEAAPAAQEALAAVPDGAGRANVLDLDKAALDALQGAKDAVAPLQAAWTAYKALVEFLGGKAPHGKTGPSASRLVAMIATDFPTDDEDAEWRTVNQVLGWATGRPVDLPQFWPFWPVVRNGARLDLVEPAEADRRGTVYPDPAPARILV
jgi:hypothetical protein